GIRDRNVTGVQTCALPISISATLHTWCVGVVLYHAGVHYVPIDCFVRKEVRQVNLLRIAAATLYMFPHESLVQKHLVLQLLCTKAHLILDCSSVKSYRHL